MYLDFRAIRVSIPKVFLKFFSDIPKVFLRYSSCILHVVLRYSLHILCLMNPFGIPQVFLNYYPVLPLVLFKVPEICFSYC